MITAFHHVFSQTFKKYLQDAITKYNILGDLHNEILFYHSPAGWEVQNQGATIPFSGKGSLSGLQVAAFLLYSRSSYFPKDQFLNSITLGLGLQHMNGVWEGETHTNTQSLKLLNVNVSMLLTHRPGYLRVGRRAYFLAL